MFESIKEKIPVLGRKSWHKALEHCLDLHEQALHPPCSGFKTPWESSGKLAPGRYLVSLWDTTHMAMNLQPFLPEHSLRQISNYLNFQTVEGMIPARLIVDQGQVQSPFRISAPPLWAEVIRDAINTRKPIPNLREYYQALILQIRWFEKHRSAPHGGFYYLDVLDRFWESGIEESPRFDSLVESDYIACVDATSHLFMLYDIASLMAQELDEDPEEFSMKRNNLQDFIQNELYCPKRKLFCDQWYFRSHLDESPIYPENFESFWPLIAGAASNEQAHSLIHEYLVNTQIFLTPHPTPSLSPNDPQFCLKGWQGPVRNAQTYWAARGCWRYRNRDAAKILLEMALDATAHQFDRSGNIWECYHPFLGHPQELIRSEHPLIEPPSSHHLGNNPLLAMAHLWKQLH